MQPHFLKSPKIPMPTPLVVHQLTLSSLMAVAENALAELRRPRGADVAAQIEAALASARSVL